MHSIHPGQPPMTSVQYKNVRSATSSFQCNVFFIMDKENNITFIFRLLLSFEKQAQHSPNRDKTFLLTVPRGHSRQLLHATSSLCGLSLCHLYWRHVPDKELLKTKSQFSWSQVCVTISHYRSSFPYHEKKKNTVYCLKVLKSKCRNQCDVPKLPHVSIFDLLSLLLSCQFLRTVCQLLLWVIIHTTSWGCFSCTLV